MEQGLMSHSTAWRIGLVLLALAGCDSRGCELEFGAQPIRTCARSCAEQGGRMIEVSEGVCRCDYPKPAKGEQ